MKKLNHEVSPRTSPDFLKKIAEKRSVKKREKFIKEYKWRLDARRALELE